MKKERNKRIKQLALWTWSWVGTLAIATFGPTFIWGNQDPTTHVTLTAFAIVFNFVIGVLMLYANRQLFNHYDELERKIHLEAMALTLGLSIIVGLSYSLLDQVDFLAADAEIGFLVGFIGVTYLITLLVIRKRYA